MCAGKFSGNFSTPRIVNEFVSEWTGVAITDNKDLYGKPERKKPRREREFTIMYGDYNEFSRVICDYKF